jgi:hypothetical protein
MNGSGIAETGGGLTCSPGVLFYWGAGMSKKVQPEEETVPFVTGGDWSVGINSGTSLQQAEVLSLLGRGLQKLYEDVVEEGVPDHLAPLLERLEEKDAS